MRLHKRIAAISFPRWAYWVCQQQQQAHQARYVCQDEYFWFHRVTAANKETFPFAYAVRQTPKNNVVSNKLFNMLQLKAAYQDLIMVKHLV
jgi:hypothetical protein